MSKARDLKAAIKAHDVGKGLAGLMPTEKNHIPQKETTRIPDKGKAVDISKIPNIILRKNGTFETRVTLVMEEHLHEKIKYLSFHERLTIKEITNEAIKKYIDDYETKNGELSPIPENRKRDKKSRYF